MAKATMFVQLTAQTYEYAGQTYLRHKELTVANVTSKKPRKPLGGTKLVKVVLVLPDSVFLDDVPVIQIDVPVETITNVAGYAESAEEAA